MQISKNSQAKKTNGLQWISNSIWYPILSMHWAVSDSEEESSLLSGRKLQQNQSEEGRPSASIEVWLRAIWAIPNYKLYEKGKFSAWS